MLLFPSRKRLSTSRAESRCVPAVDLAIPAFGYKNHVSIDQGFGLIRNWTTTHARRARWGRAASKTFWTERTRRATSGADSLPVGEERSDARAARVRVAHPSAGSRRADRYCLSACVSPTRRNPKSAAWSNTCSRIRRRTDGPHRAHDRHSPRQGENRHGQSRLQHAPVRLVEDEMPSCITETVVGGHKSVPIATAELVSSSRASDKPPLPLTTGCAKMRLLEASSCLSIASKPCHPNSP